ncbi:hypothetical protein V8F06_008436 [Rhypophila decipiens]
MPCFTLESHAKLSILTYLMDEPVVRAFLIFAVLSSPPVWAFYWLTTNDCGVAWRSITSRYGIVGAFTFGTHSFLRSFLHGGCEYLRRSRRTARHFLSFWVFFFFRFFLLHGLATKSGADIPHFSAWVDGGFYEDHKLSTLNAQGIKMEEGLIWRC